MDAVGMGSAERHRALALSTFAFALCFAAWTLFSIIGIEIKRDLDLTDTEFGLLVATPILSGSLSRLVLGIWADRHGARRVFALLMLASAGFTALLSGVSSFPMFLLAALGVGLAGGSFAVGVAYVSRWYPMAQQGTALGVFGVGNIGAAATSFGVPLLLLALDWRGAAQVYAASLTLAGILFFALAKDEPTRGTRPSPRLRDSLAPLKKLQVWRFALYYFFAFGAFVALALWLPHYIVGVYGFDLATAGLLTAVYTAPASLFRVYGGYLSDRYGARKVMYWTLGVSALCTFVLAHPAGVVGPALFAVAIAVLGFFMSLGKAAVYKYIPLYYPDHVGAVGGLVGTVGGLGGFVLPVAFGALQDVIGLWSACFMLLFLLAAICLAWMHAAVRSLGRAVSCAE